MARTTIRSEDITGLQVKTGDIAADAVTAAKIASGAVDTTGLEDDIALLGFKVASNGSLAKYNLVDQTVDGFEDDSGVNSGGSTNAVRNESNYYEGAAAGAITYSAHTSTGADTWTCPAGVTTAEIVVVAGGGGGGQRMGGGGGAGGVVHHATYTTVPAVVYDLTVGVGGSGAAGGTNGNVGGTGGNSSFNDNAEGSQSKMTANGGGGGAHYNGGAATSGGSGGGSCETATTPGTGTQGDSGGGTGYGSNGGSGGGGYGGCGGGGATTTGGEQTSSGTGSAGGTGKLLSNFTSYGESGYFGGGGGGDTHSGTGTVGPGGNGGGGDGRSGAGSANTGGGGGGHRNSGDSGGITGGSGGSGVVVIRYQPITEGANMTLVSATQAAQAAPTKGDIVLTYTNGSGSTTLGTDLTAEISADGGSTWTAMTLGSEGSTGAHNIATAHDVTISSTITAPYNMAYRVKTLNQGAGSKTTRIQAVSLGWS